MVEDERVRCFLAPSWNYDASAFESIGNLEPSEAGTRAGDIGSREIAVSVHSHWEYRVQREEYVNTNVSFASCAEVMFVACVKQFLRLALFDDAFFTPLTDVLKEDEEEITYD